MLNALWWLLAIEVIALAVFPLAYHLLPSLRDRGYSISKPLGLLLIGYVSWILSQIHLVPSTRVSLAAMVLVLACVSGWLAWRRRADLLLFLKKEWRVVALAEAVFLVFFVAWTLYRAYDPSIDHTEQPMDFAFLNASILTLTGPPQDPWLSGESVSYYYFGYWMMGALTELTGIASNISYNLAMALVPAMAAQAVFGLTYSIVRSQTARLGTAVAGAGAAVLLLGVAANLEGIFEFMRANAIGSQGFWDWLGIKGLDGPLGEPTAGWYPQEFWWWFRATRVINTFEGTLELDYTIQEFPSFSLILGDLHPHVMAIPFALLAAAFCWDLFRRERPGLSHLPRIATDGPNGASTGSYAGWWRGAGTYAYMLALGLALGGLAFTNMWDLPTYASLLLGVGVLKAYSLRTKGDGGGPTPAGVWTAPLLIAAGGIALAVLLFLPYHLTLQSSVSGIAPVQVTTRPVHMGIVWGLYLAVIVPFIIGAFWKTTLSEDWGRTAGLALGVAALPIVVWALLHMENGGTTSDIWDRLVGVLPLASLIAIAVFTTFSSVRAEGATGGSFALAMSALGLMLIMGPELLFIDDAFGTRMNTVFKLYYQAWIILAVAAGFAFHFWANLGDRGEGWKRTLGTIWAAVVCLLLLASLYYPPAAAASKAESFSGDGTLDGLAYVSKLRPAERDAIEFLRREAGRDSTMVEAVGEWFDFGLISRSTGVPTVFNWPGHEVQWRGSADQFKDREQDVADIYQSERWDHVQNLLARYDVEYVYVGPRERSKYGTEGLEKFGELMDTVFSKDDVTIYRVR